MGYCIDSPTVFSLSYVSCDFVLLLFFGIWIFHGVTSQVSLQCFGGARISLDDTSKRRGKGTRNQLSQQLCS